VTKERKDMFQKEKEGIRERKEEKERRLRRKKKGTRRNKKGTRRKENQKEVLPIFFSLFAFLLFFTISFPYSIRLYSFLLYISFFSSI